MTRLAWISTPDGIEGFAVSDTGRDWTALPPLGVRAGTADAISALGDPANSLDVAPRYDSVEVEFGCPIVRPSKIVGVGYNYAAHAAEIAGNASATPTLFGKYPSALNGPFDDVVVDPELTTKVDYEAELAVVIGRPCRAVSRNDALSAVFGYAVANDVSARDCQQEDVQVSRAKGFDSFCPIGPWIVCADEICDPQKLIINSWVNGEIRQSASTALMLHGVASLISYITRGITLEPGDVILTGSPSGVGQGLIPPKYLSCGDTVACEIERIGRIENKVALSPVSPNPNGNPAAEPAARGRG